MTLQEHIAEQEMKTKRWALGSDAEFTDRSNKVLEGKFLDTTGHWHYKWGRKFKGEQAGI